MNGTRRVRTAGGVARGVGALLLLAALLAGIPALLLAVIGLPSGLPSAADLRGYLSRPDDGTVFIAAASAIAWAGWAVFAVSIAVEAAGAARGRPWQLPGLSGVQRPAAHLVSAVVVLLAGTATPTLGGFPARPAAAALHTPPDPASEAGPVSSTAAATDRAATAPAARPAAASGREIVVAPRDTLWALAERHCGDPLGWRALAKANYGRPQPDGRRLTDAHWIYPGWRLQLPASWTQAAHSRPTAPQRPGDEGVPRRLPHPPPGDPVPTSQAQAPPGASPTPAARPPLGPGGQAPAPTPTPATSRANPPAGPVIASPPDADSGDAARVVGLAGSGLLAAGLLLELRRHRRRQQRHRGPGQRIPLPSLEGAETESALHRAADPAAANALRLVLRRLAEQAPAAAAAVRAAELRPSQLRLWLASDQPPPAPWQPGPDPGTWTLDAAGRRKLLTDAVPAATPDPLPGLVTVGRTVDGGYLLWNLEAAVVTAVAGPPSVTTAWLRTAALELATSPWSGGGWFELAVVGFDVPDLDRVSRYPSLAAAIDAVEHRAAETRDAMTGLDPQTPPAARLARPDDDRLAPTLLLTAEVPTAGEMARLQAATGVGTLALVPAEPAGTAAALSLDAVGAAAIPQLGLSVAAQALTAEEIDAVSALFATAAAPPVPAGAGRYAELTGGDLLAERQLVPADARPAPGRRADPTTARTPRPRRREAVAPTVLSPAAPAPPDVAQAGVQAAEPESPPPGSGARTASPDGPVPGSLPPSPRQGGIEVCILGPVTVRWSAVPVTGRALELVVMLALAGPAGITPDRLDTYLATDSDTPNTRSNRRHEIVSRTRKALGPAAGGAQAVLRDGAVYRLHPSVSLDYSRLVAFTDRGGREDLRAALALVRGVPLDGLDLWWFPNHGLSIGNDAVSRIIDAAETLAFLEFDDGNPAAAEAAIRAGLRAGPDERLYQALMIVRGSDPAAVERAWQECAAALAAAEDSPGEETVATYRRILAAQRRASA